MLRQVLKKKEALTMAGADGSKRDPEHAEKLHMVGTESSTRTRSNTFRATREPNQI